ncbi:MAG TPA: ABC transporter permease [Gemmataceae bacterium]|jgi:ABC-type multidrug transport system permease subunit|nr:ABC transporter permease [Gemmataceae bacterium]
MNPKRYYPLLQLTASRFREFYREPAAVFWVYGFPLIMAVALGIAFRERPIEKIKVVVREDVGSPEAVAQLKEQLAKDERFEVAGVTGEEWKKRLRSGKTDLVVAPATSGYELWDEPNRTESVLARHAVEATIYKQSATNAPPLDEKHLEEKGNRYIDFLVPGMLGMNLMGGGLWGVGYVLADMRVRKLLKRYLATPMKRRDFLLSVLISRMLFTIPEVLVLLLFGYFVFDVKNQGSLGSLVFLIVFGAACFGGLGLLVASRAKTIETVSGLMNLVMLPMYIVSGVFFSSERFPDVVQPIIKLLPLTAMNDALRGVMLEGKSLDELGRELLVLAVWGLIPFAVALKIFRWR